MEHENRVILIKKMDNSDYVVNLSVKIMAGQHLPNITNNSFQTTNTQ